MTALVLPGARSSGEAEDTDFFFFAEWSLRCHGCLLEIHTCLLQSAGLVVLVCLNHPHCQVQASLLPGLSSQWVQAQSLGEHSLFNLRLSLSLCIPRYTLIRCSGKEPKVGKRKDLVEQVGKTEGKGDRRSWSSVNR